MVDTILDAAARVLRKHGYDDTTTNRVAEIAGVSVGSVYQYFPNKEAMVHALIERHDAAMWAVFTDHVTTAIGRPFADAVPAVIDALFAAHLVDPDLHRVLHQQLPRVGALTILHCEGARSVEQSTDDGGAFVFRDVPPGACTLQVLIGNHNRSLKLQLKHSP